MTGNKFLSIITLNENDHDSAIKGYRLQSGLKMRSNYMLFARGSLYRKIHPQAEDEKKEKYISYKWRLKSHT